jgi:multiple sugar transport system permease protein
MSLLKNRQKRNDMFFVLSIVVPVMLLFIVIRYYPMADTLITSFFRKSMIRPGQTFIGLENYQYILTDPEFKRSLLNTAGIAFFSMTISVILGLFLASIINNSYKKFAGMKLFQASLFIPVIVSMVPSTLMWKMLFDYNFGMINFLLSSLGIKSINWINNESIVRWPIIIISIWKELGYNMMIFYVGLKAIPRELFESADIDGSNRSQKMRFITLPQLKPITLFISVVSLIKFVKVFTQAFIMTSGSQASGNIYKTLVYYIYQQGFQLQSMGRASAASIILLVIVFFLTWLQMRLSKEK